MAAGDGGASAVDGELAERRAAIGQKLDASAAARQESADRRREAAQRTNDPSEDVDAFLRSFEAEIGGARPYPNQPAGATLRQLVECRGAARRWWR